MIKKICCAVLLASASLPPAPALAWDGYRCCDWRGGVWGGRRAWDGGYGWRLRLAGQRLLRPALRMAGRARRRLLALVVRSVGLGVLREMARVGVRWRNLNH